MAQDLTDLRKEIDSIDRQIVSLYEQRMDVCREVAQYKIENGKKVFDSQREQEKLHTVCSLADNDAYRTGVQELFELIMSTSRKMQYQMLSDAGAMGRLPFMEVEQLNVKRARVVFQGAEGAYSQAAMQRFFGKNVNSFHVETFRDAMCAIEEGSADFAVLPIENSTAGIVSEIYDLLQEFDNYIVGEQIIEIEQCLLALPGTKKEDIRVVYSHPQSLMQTARYLSNTGWQQISMKNNAFAAQKVVADARTDQAAVAGANAAEIYGLEVLERGINDEKGNCTRFIVVTNQKIFCKDAKKISICFEIPHESGSLYHMLSHFIFNDLNMTKIESRPIEGRNWEYRFFIDFEGNLADSAVKNALRGLREETRSMKILGNY
ncbi:MAG: prephenate dehydratase [Lachnospiraceae bacterium]|nr:prephenate dehydratase [Lachnospiraceae bacterium]